MLQEDLHARIDAYIDEVWEDIVSDIATLVSIPSIEDLPGAKPGAPYGEGPAQALEAGLALAARLGFESHNCEGHIGYADLSGKSAKQIGMIGHLDTVPVGTGWSSDPYTVVRKDGYLVGRGVLDDKGPSVVALYVMKFFKEMSEESGEQLPYTLRMILGANEETGMCDTTYYRERYEDPAFLFTPDGDFPVCYGEKGRFTGAFLSKPLNADGMIVSMEGGTALNAVAGQASAQLRCSSEGLEGTERVQVSADENGTRLIAEGIGGHASLPEGTINAIGLLVDYILEHELCSADEQAFLEVLQKVLSASDGSNAGVAATDEYFSPLTIIGGTMAVKDGCLEQTVDVRYPTSTSAKELVQRLQALGQLAGVRFTQLDNMDPYLVEPDSPMIVALLDSFNDATGMNKEAFTLGGGTYAREFSSAASFGPNMPWLVHPEWAGIEHMANEAVQEDMLRKAMKIYILTIQKLMQLEF